MRGHLIVGVALAALAGGAAAQAGSADAPRAIQDGSGSPAGASGSLLAPLTDALMEGTSAVTTGVSAGIGAIVGTPAPGGTKRGPAMAGSGLLGTADFLGDVLNGLGNELRDGAAEGGALVGNTLASLIQALVIRVGGGAQAMPGGLQSGPGITRDPPPRGIEQQPAAFGRIICAAVVHTGDPVRRLFPQCRPREETLQSAAVSVRRPGERASPLRRAHQIPVGAVWLHRAE